jgi:hypothetical protein
LTTKLWAIRHSNFRVDVVAAFAPLFDGYGSRFPAAKNQTIRLARREIVLRKGRLVLFVFFAVGRFELPAAYECDGVHVSLACFARHGKHNDGLSRLRSYGT